VFSKKSSTAEIAKIAKTLCLPQKIINVIADE
jgi:hypothetical protein